MYQINHCLACLSTEVELHPAHFARFIAWHTSGHPVDSDLATVGMKCTKCSFVASVDRFDQQETKNLYNNYRGKEYTRIRNICEPNYQELTFGEEYRKQRQIGIQKLLEQIDVDQIHTVLDYGGDNGSMIPDCVSNAKKYMFDLSSNNTLPGIQKYTPDIEKTFDFLMCCHVLEHQSSPADLLAELKKCAHEDTLFYFEIPNNPDPYIGTFHEHINFFNIQSLTALLERHGFEIVDFYEYGFESVIPCHKNNLCVLAKLKLTFAKDNVTINQIEEQINVKD